MEDELLTGQGSAGVAAARTEDIADRHDHVPARSIAGSGADCQVERV
ncbi:hypothetical protein [Pseudonocardia sp. GCM10023141]